MTAGQRKLYVNAQRRAICAAIRDGHNWGTGIIAETGLAMSVVYRGLRTLREAGWVTRELEDTAEALGQGRSERHLYTLTGDAYRGLGWPE